MSMENRVNILKEVMREENEVTRMLYALCAYRAFREVLVRFLTGDRYGAEDVAWEDMGIQATIDGVKPDFYALGESLSLLLEIKTSLYTGLTSAQPANYLAWLARHPRPGKRFFVALIPARYIHRGELEKRLVPWLSKPIEPLVTVTILEWEGFLEALRTTGLEEINPYVSDFYDVLNSWLAEPPIKFTYLEVEKMYTRETASGIANLLKLVERVAAEMEKSYQIEKSFNRRWWDNGEYGIYIREGDHNLFWFGIWQAYWEHSGVPLCYGVQQNWGDALVRKFQSLHPQYITFPKGDPNPFFLEKVGKEVFLAEYQVGKIVGLLEQELQNLSPQVDSTSALPA
jgi:hypothetical protein